MVKLTDEVKTEIVQRLARYEGYSNIARAVSIKFGVTVTRFQVRTYDPTKPTFAAGEKWRIIFVEARRKYCQEIEAIPISHKAFRLNQLQWVLDRANRSGNLVLVNKTLEQAAKEVGNIAATERAPNLRDSELKSYKLFTPEERYNSVTEIFRSVIEKIGKEKNSRSG